MKTTMIKTIARNNMTVLIKDVDVEEKEMTKEEKEESNKRYELWQKNTYNPFIDYYNLRNDVKK